MIEIQNRKHFNAVLVSLKTTSDILKNFDQLYTSKHGSRHMLGNSIRLKAPELSLAFASYCAAVEAGAAKTAFAKWAVAEKLIPVELVEAAKSGKDIIPYREVRHVKMGIQNTRKAAITIAQKAEKESVPICLYCGMKAKDIATHSCHKTSGKAKKHKSIWVISGGGANGIRNKR